MSAATSTTPVLARDADSPTERPPLGRLLDELGVTRAALAAEMGVGRRSVTRWCAGVDRPGRIATVKLNRWLAARGRCLSAAFGGPLAEITPFPRSPSTTTPHEEDMEITNYEPVTPALLKHFGLAADPFENPESPDDIWRSPALARIEAILEVGLKQRQILALVGDPGSGKSTLIRRLCSRSAGQRQIRVISPASLDRARIDASALAMAIIRDLTGKQTSGMATEARSELLRTTLAEAKALGTYPVLVIDEAHLLSNRALIAIKQVWDSHLSTRELAVILVGQLGLKERLKRDTTLREVTGRTAIVEVPRLGKDAADYLAWRFSRVNARPVTEVFTPEAIRLLERRAEHPLWLNNLAVRAMNVAMTVAGKVVDEAHVGKA